jgi:hypothetical protein
LKDLGGLYTNIKKHFINFKTFLKTCIYTVLTGRKYRFFGTKRYNFQEEIFLKLKTMVFFHHRTIKQRVWFLKNLLTLSFKVCMRQKWREKCQKGAKFTASRGQCPAFWISVISLKGWNWYVCSRLAVTG